jgi:hypothetical protein
MESEHSENFNERLSQWIANQGFWFQIRYSLSSSGAQGAALFHLLKLGYRLLIFLLIVAAGISAYLVMRKDFGVFGRDFKSSVKSALTASEIQLGPVTRSRGHLEISRFAFGGNADTFFTALEARGIRAKMGYLDGLIGDWDLGMVSIARLDVDLRAGADDAKSAESFAQALFKQSDRILVNSLEVADASLRWGYSNSTRGSIDNSAMRVYRIGSGFKISFKGGTFSQNWLRKLEIVELVAMCQPDGILFEKAEFRSERGSVDLSGLRVTGGARPTVAGLAKIRRLGLDSALPPAMRSFVEGSLSGDFQVSGSTNSSEGISFAGQVTLDGLDTIALRERIHLLKALSVVDYVRNYYRVEFHEGSFFMRTGNGGIELKDVELKASDLFTLVGQMSARLPTDAETKESLRKNLGAAAEPLFKIPGEEDLVESKAKDDAFSLRKAAKASQTSTDGAGTQKSDDSNLFGKLGLSNEMRRFEEQAIDRSSKTLRFQGEFLITLLPDAFERAPRLVQQFPVDLKSGRIPMVIPLEGTLYELTLIQAQDIYQQGTR